MAVDTANKRYSMIGYDMPFIRVYAEPDGDITLPDRQQFLFKYSGLAFQTVASGTTPFRTLMGVGI